MNEHWSGLKAETGRNEAEPGSLAKCRAQHSTLSSCSRMQASEYIMEWIFSTYNDLLVDLNDKAKGGLFVQSGRSVSV